MLLEHPTPAWVLRDGEWHPGDVIAWRKLENGRWRATVRYTIDLLQYQHGVDQDEVKPRDDLSGSSAGSA